MMLNYCLAEQGYYTYKKIDSTLSAWNDLFGKEVHPSFGDYGVIYNLDTIGYSSRDSLPIFAVKISDNANLDEDETRVLILGQCHAEEIYGVEIAMALIECFIDPGNCSRLDVEECGFDCGFEKGMLDNYLSIFLDKLEIWVVPTYNPEGLKVVHGYCDDSASETPSECSLNNGSWVEDPSYRKNGKDVNNNGTFIEQADWLRVIGQDEDGVDLNRNYDLNWIFGHDKLQQTNGTQYASCNNFYDDDFDYYKGEHPFSETESQAIRDFALDKKFLLSIAYHSSRSGCIAEKVIFPWGWKEKTDQDSDRKKSPDFSVIKILGDKLHNILGFPKDGDYYAKPQGGRYGNAHDWLYRETGSFQYLIEVGDFDYQADGLTDSDLLIDDKFDETLDRNIGVLFYLFMNAVGEADVSVAGHSVNLSLITGIITDEEGNILENAIIKVLEMDGLVLKPRTTDKFGRYRRLLYPDSSYTLIVSAPGYLPDSISIQSEELIAGINYPFDIRLESQPPHQLKINIQTPDNYTGDIQAILHGSFSSDTTTVTNNIVWVLPEDNYLVTITASGLSPTVIETHLNGSKEYSIYLDIEQTIMNEDFINLSQWETQIGDWILDGHTLSTQSELFYDNNVDWEIVSKNGIAVEVGDSLIIEIRLRYELEWEYDYFSMFYISGDNTTELLQLTGDHYNFLTKYIPLEIKEGQANGKILFALNSDQNLNYRGVEIDKLVIHNGGNYTGDDLSNSFDLLPGNFVLYQNYPNPFNPTTNIQFSVPNLSPVSISIYNVRGEFIEYLVNEVYKPGNYTMHLDAGDYSSGIYFYRLQTDNSVITRKFIIIK